MSPWSLETHLKTLLSWKQVCNNFQGHISTTPLWELLPGRRALSPLAFSFLCPPHTSTDSSKPVTVEIQSWYAPKAKNLRFINRESQLALLIKTCIVTASVHHWGDRKEPEKAKLLLPEYFCGLALQANLDERSSNHPPKQETYTNFSWHFPFAKQQRQW